MSQIEKIRFGMEAENNSLKPTKELTKFCGKNWGHQ